MMNGWLWALTGGGVFIILLLVAKIHMLRKAAREIEEAFADRLMADTNTLIDISSNDQSMRSLANVLNEQLRELRAQRHRYLLGDRELKNAVTNIAHDLRTPLTAICGYLDLLEREESTEASLRYIGIMKDRAGMLSELTEELFRYSVIVATEGDARVEPVLVNEVLEESIAAFYHILKDHGITPVIRLTEEKVIRHLDPSSLTRIFSNLLNNAVKYSDGDLEIALSETGEILFSNRASGLDEAQVGRLFDRFYTVETARKSTGLGLAISKTLVEQMNGTITASYHNLRLSICIVFPC